jgi:leader peptidase (prepilin peptidase) / N-methyltransferase
MPQKPKVASTVFANNFWVILLGMDAVIILLLACLGWLSGGVINLSADQLPIEGKFSRPKCHNCHTPQSWGRFLWLRKCQACGASRMARGWFVQFIFILLAIILWYYPGARLPFYLLYPLIAYFGLVTLIDLEHRLVLGPVSLVGVLLGLGVGVFLHGWIVTLFGLVGGAAIMLAIYGLGLLFSKWMAKRRQQPVEEEALGLGDVYIAGILGLILGWPGITAGLLGGILIGGLISGLVLLWMFLRRKYQPFMALPYAPFLIAAALVLLLRPS